MPPPAAEFAQPWHHAGLTGPDGHETVVIPAAGLYLGEILVEVKHSAMSVPRFAAVGLANTAIDYSVYAGLLAAGLPPQAANLASVTTAATFSFLANRNFTFRAHRAATPLGRQVLRHAMVASSALVISAAVIHLTAPLVGPLIAKAIAIPVSFVWNYGLSSRWVWRRRQQP